VWQTIVDHEGLLMQILVFVFVVAGGLSLSLLSPGWLPIGVFLWLGFLVLFCPAHFVRPRAIGTSLRVFGHGRVKQFRFERILFDLGWDYGKGALLRVCEEGGRWSKVWSMEGTSDQTVTDRLLIPLLRKHALLLSPHSPAVFIERNETSNSSDDHVDCVVIITRGCLAIGVLSSHSVFGNHVTPRLGKVTSIMVAGSHRDRVSVGDRVDLTLIGPGLSLTVGSSLVFDKTDSM
jgi:hypothetical protein